MKRALFRTRHFHSSRASLWNPFKKKAVLDTSITPVDATVVMLRQRLRAESEPIQLGEMLSILQKDSTPGVHSFSLMNEVIKKMDKSAKTSPNEIIPGLTIERCSSLFSHVIDTITPENYKSARFIPRLYLQITKEALRRGDDELLLETLGQFIKYLNNLGYEEQLLKVIAQFHSEFPQEIIKRSSKVIIDFVDSNQALHPSLLLKLLEIYPNEELYKLCLEKTLQLDPLSIDERDLEGIKGLLKMTEKFAFSDDLLKLCDLYGDAFPDLGSDYMKMIIGRGGDSFILMKLILKRPFDASVDINPIIAHSRDPKIMSVIWDIYQNGFSKETEANLQDLDVSNEYFQLIMLASVNSQFQSNVNVIDSLKDLGFEPTTETYKYLLSKPMNAKDTSAMKKLYQDSMMDGIEWVNDKKTLNKFFTILANEEGLTNCKEVFQFSKKVKVHLTYLDADSYSAFVNMTLQNRFIDDTIESFKQELPPLKKDMKYKIEDYSKLYQVIFEWINETSEDGEDIWAIYSSFIKYFEVPYDWYFPLIKRLSHYERPDLGFQVFQDMKRIHRTTGSIPPPNPEMYIHLFKQFGRHTYSEGVETLDAIFKVDLTINSSLPLLNSIMDAYCSLKNFTKVSQVYDQITASPSGPNNETVSIMLKAHTLLSLNNVKSYWNDMDTLGLLPNEDNFQRYIIAHCYYGNSNRALQIAQEMEDMDAKVTPEILKSLYQWTKDDDVRLLIENWAQREHNQIWSSIQSEVKNVPVPIYEVPKSLEELGPTQEELRLMKS